MDHVLAVGAGVVVIGILGWWRASVILAFAAAVMFIASVEKPFHGPDQTLR